METEVLDKKIVEIEAKPAWLELWERKSKMTVEEQIKERDRYWAENWDAIIAEGMAIDERLAQCENLIENEDEIEEIIRKDRRERYEASLRH